MNWAPGYELAHGTDAEVQVELEGTDAAVNRVVHTSGFFGFYGYRRAIPLD